MGATRAETGTLVGGAAACSAGCVLMIKDADAWHGLPDRGQHVLLELYKKLTEYRDELRDELAVILAGDGSRCGSCCTPPRRWPPGSARSSNSPATSPPSSARSSPRWLPMRA